MTVSTTGDIKINGLDYLLGIAGYHVSQSPTTEPRSGGATSDIFLHADNWTYWGQEKWYGMNFPDWEIAGPFFDGYGLDLSIQGQINVAKQLVVTKADTNDPLGYVAVPLGHNWLVFIGKSSGTMFSSANAGSSWNTNADCLGTGIKPRGTYGILKNKYYVGSTQGKLAQFVFNDDGTGAVTFLDQGAGGPSPNDTYVLGSYKGKLWVGSDNRIDTYDGTTWTQMFAGNVDGTPICGAVGNNVMYMITSGPAPRLLVTDGNALLQAAVLSSDFSPTAAVFLESLYIFGAQTDDANTRGEVWRMEEGGIKPLFEYGTDNTQDWGIRSAYVDRGVILWGANRKTGVGVYDPDLDLYSDISMGFYVGSTIDSIAGATHGIIQSKNVVYCGIEGSGIYKQGTPGTYKLRSSVFGGSTRHINKLWGFSELHHSALATGQTCTLKTLKDGATLDTWGTSSTVAATQATINAPANYKNPYLQFEISGTANGAAMTIFDVSLAYIEIADNPKKEWALIIAVEGTAGDKQMMRDGTDNTRTAITMLGELNALWNKVVTFDDIEGTQYTAIFKVPSYRESQQTIRGGYIIRNVTAGVVDRLSIAYHVHLTQL